MDTIKNIIIVGGGFAGTAAVRRLNRALPGGYRLVVISEESYTTFHPMLPEAVGASIFPEQVVAPLREIIDVKFGHQFVMGRVQSVDKLIRTVTCSTLNGALTLPYEHLILACGNRARLDLLPGMEQHALPLKTVGDAMHIRNTVLRRLAAAELAADPILQARLVHFAVIGGGFSGVEVAGELVDCLASISRYYPRIGNTKPKVTIIHDGDALLPELPKALGVAAAKSLQQRGVELRLQARAAHISEQGAHFADGSVIDAGTVIATVGTRPNALIESLDLPLNRGRIAVEDDLRISGSAGLWAVGDCALIPNAYDKNFAPPTAQYAVREGTLVAGNILAVLHGRETQHFNYRSRGMMAAIGHMRGVAEIFGVHLSGLPAWLAWRAYYLSQMPTFGRKLRIFVEWTWGMFFSVDITHLRFTRSREIELDSAKVVP